MIVQIICTEEEYERSIKPLGINNVRVIKELKNVRDGRILFLKELLSFGITTEQFYRRVRKRGYSYSRRTLARDLNIMEEEGFCKIKIFRGGSEGTYNIINKPQTKKKEEKR